jgi:hypothetical protein
VRDKRPITLFLMVSLIASVLIVLLQQKGWRYHLIAANGLSLVTLGLLWARSQSVELRPITKLILPLGLLAVMWFAIIQPVILNLKSNGQPLEPNLAQIIRETPKDKHIAILSTAPDFAFFPLARAGRPHWSRHFSMWMMPGLLTPQTGPAKEANRLRQRAIVLNEFRADLTCTPPDLIIGEVGYFRNPNWTKFDAMGVLIEDRAFNTWLATHYARQPNLNDFPVWRLKGLKPAPQNC